MSWAEWRRENAGLVRHAARKHLLRKTFKTGNMTKRRRQEKRVEEEVPNGETVETVKTVEKETVKTVEKNVGEQEKKRVAARDRYLQVLRPAAAAIWAEGKPKIMYPSRQAAANRRRRSRGEFDCVGKRRAALLSTPLETRDLQRLMVSPP